MGGNGNRASQSHQHFDISQLPAGLLSTKPSRQRNMFGLLVLLNCQLIFVVIGLLVWVIPRGMQVTKTRSYSDQPQGTPFQTTNTRASRRPGMHQKQLGAISKLKSNQRRVVLPKRNRDRGRYPRVLYYVHIHKGAGTLFCAFADLNKASINKHWNCNVQEDQRCCGGADSLEAQLQYSKTTNFDIVAIEREMYEFMAPSHYDYVVTLRDSKRRYYSHWGHLRRLIPIGPGVQNGGFGNSAWIFGNNTIEDIKTTKRKIDAGVDPLGNFTVWSEGQPDNWNTRILCGPRCRPRTKFQITPELFNYTLSRVEKFAHFLFVEDMEASYNKFASFYNLNMYKNIAPPDHVQKVSNRREDKDEADIEFETQSWNPFMSALDDALYEFARRRYQNDTEANVWRPFSNQVMLDRYFEEGWKEGCTDGCCGHCTSY